MTLFCLLGTACGTDPGVTAAGSQQGQSFPQYKSPEDYGYVNRGYLCSQVVTIMYSPAAHVCVFASNACETSYLAARGFRGDSSGICEIAD